MSVNPVSTINQTGNAAGVSPRRDRSHPEELQDTPAAVFEKSGEAFQPQKPAYSGKSAAAGEISGHIDQKYVRLTDLVETLLTTQTLKTKQSEGLSYSLIVEKYEGNLKNILENLPVDDDTRLKAQQEISEDGFWGVKQTAARIIEFAKSLAGGDSSKLEELKAAIEKGYAQAEKAWGGKLPDICYQTKDAIMKGLDDWSSAA